MTQSKSKMADKAKRDLAEIGASFDNYFITLNGIRKKLHKLKISKGKTAKKKIETWNTEENIDKLAK
jgi:hypothetical protein